MKIDHLENNNRYLGDATLTQFSTMGALLVGLYDGAFRVSDVRHAGHLGLGCSHGVDGEMVLIDGDCYIARANSPLRKMRDDERVPFAQVADFAVTDQLALRDLIGKNALTEQLLAHAGTKNLFIGFRIEGLFSKLTLRQPPGMPKKPYPPMVEVLSDQSVFDVSNQRGTLIGFWSPKLYQGVTVADIHLHFIDHERTLGGHVLDVDISEGMLVFQCFSRFTLHLPTHDDALRADMDYADLDAHIRQAEG